MLTIRIKTSNAAFQDGNREAEIARILRELAERIEDDEYPAKLKDVNGNTVGTVEGHE